MLTKVELLKKYHRKACGDLYMLSENYLMNTASPGHEEEWKAAQEEVAFLEAWIKKFGGNVYDCV